LYRKSKVISYLRLVLQEQARGSAADIYTVTIIGTSTPLSPLHGNNGLKTIILYDKNFEAACHV